MAAILCIYFVVEYRALRADQHQIYTCYEMIRQAVQEQDYEQAYALLSPADRKRYSLLGMKGVFNRIAALGPAGSIYSVHVYGNTVVIVPNPATTRWYVPSDGDLWAL